MKSESLARIVVIVLALGAGIAAMAFRVWTNSKVIEVHAAMPDRGGWLTSDIDARVGEPLNLRLISDDVVHSFAIGQIAFDPVDLLPGKPKDISLTFDEAGTYTFYCTRWCGEDHWRMRGTITVVDENPLSDEEPEPALYMTLGIDLDDKQVISEYSLLEGISSDRGEALGISIPNKFKTQDYYRSHSPGNAWNDLRKIPVTKELSDSQVWDLIAFNWSEFTTTEKISQGQMLYERDCAACHGLSGKGDGVFAVNNNMQDNNNKSAEFGQIPEETANFSNPTRTLGVSPALLQGKILRGGMGTGMPSWGLVYTDEQTWALVDYLWTFVFKNIEE